MNETVEIYLLEQLSVLSECRTLAEASEKLHLTQPTLTRSVQKLEGIIGVSLFDREKNRIYINENGKLAAEYAKRIIDMESDMILRIRSLDKSRHMITLGTCAPGPIMEIIPQLQRVYPEKRIAYELKSCEELLSGLVRDEYQMIITDYPIKQEDIVCREWGQEQLYISVMPAHPAAVMKEVDFSMINGQSFLVYSNLGIWESIVRTNMPNSKFLVQKDMDELLEIVNASTLPAFETDLGMHMCGKRKNRVQVPISNKSATVTFYCVCKRINANMFKSWLGVD